MRRGDVDDHGGEGGIRTLETLRSATLAVWCLQPLGHLSTTIEYQTLRKEWSTNNQKLQRGKMRALRSLDYLFARILHRFEGFKDSKSKK